jgi:hypothetical protein
MLNHYEINYEVGDLVHLNPTALRMFNLELPDVFKIVAMNPDGQATISSIFVDEDKEQNVIHIDWLEKDPVKLRKFKINELK